MHVRRRLATILALTGMAGAGGLVAAVPAQAVGDVQVIDAISANDSVAIKSVTATCPAGEVVYGGGGTIGGGTGHDVRLSGLRPVVNLLGLSGFQATATEDDTGYADDWTVRAYAVCGPKLAGHQVVWQTSPSSSDSSRSATAVCPNGKKVISAGGAVANGGGGVVLQLIVPNNDLEWVAVNAYEDETGYTGKWQLTAYAVCANSLYGLELVAAASPVGDGSSTNLATVFCPEGKVLLGVGGHAFGGVPSFGELYLYFLFPQEGDPGGAIVHGTTDETGFATGWFVTAYAICAY
jgi:hypothetical protein